MARRRKDPLRELTPDERRHLTGLRRSSAAPAGRVARAVLLLAVADGADYQTAARAAGRKSGDAISHLVGRFNCEGLAALEPRHGGGRVRTYEGDARARILREAARTPKPSARRPGRSRRCSAPFVPRPTGYPPSPLSPSGGYSARRATPSSGPAPGARPARRCAAASRAS
ncbi:MAG: hypothetical protein U0840_20535 [Gemmataceae bacterium]